MNSLLALLALLAVLLFGYLTLIRILARNYFSDAETIIKQPDGSLLLRSIGAGSLFLLLPSISLLLFWGWGPACLWVIFYHLCFDSICNVSLTGSTWCFDASNSVRGINWINQLLAVACASIALSFAANILDKNGGLWFLLGCVLLALTILRFDVAANQRFLRALCAILLVAAGFIGSLTLGLTVFGSITPLSNWAPWLTINNSSLIVFFLLLLCTRIQHDSSLPGRFGLLSGVLFALLLLLLIGGLAVQQAPLDAPISSAHQRSADLPSLWTIGLFLFVGNIFLWFRQFEIYLFNRGQRDVLLDSLMVEYNARQSSSLFQLLFALVLIIGLATAVGIGAWNTHYIDWQISRSLQSHFDLLASMVMALAGFADLPLVKTLFTGMLLIMAVSFAVHCCSIIQFLNSQIDHQDSNGSVWSSSEWNTGNWLQLLAIYLLSLWFLHYGVSVSSWLAAGLLAWLAFGQQLAWCNDYSNPHRRVNQAVATLVLVYIAAGTLQALALAIKHVLLGNWLFTFYALLIPGLAIWAWLEPMKKALAVLSAQEEESSIL